MSEKIVNNEPLVLTVIDRINAIKTDQEKYNTLQRYLPNFFTSLRLMVETNFKDIDEPIKELDKVNSFHALKSSSNPHTEKPDFNVEDAVENQIHSFLNEFDVRYSANV